MTPGLDAGKEPRAVEVNEQHFPLPLLLIFTLGHFLIHSMRDKTSLPVRSRVTNTRWCQARPDLLCAASSGKMNRNYLNPLRGLISQIFHIQSTELQHLGSRASKLKNHGMV